MKKPTDEELANMLREAALASPGMNRLGASSPTMDEQLTATRAAFRALHDAGIAWAIEALRREAEECAHPRYHQYEDGERYHFAANYLERLAKEGGDD